VLLKHAISISYSVTLAGVESATLNLGLHGQDRRGGSIGSGTGAGSRGSARELVGDDGTLLGVGLGVGEAGSLRAGGGEDLVETGKAKVRV
jgi:hypothetical protein